MMNFAKCPFRWPRNIFVCHHPASSTPHPFLSFVHCFCRLLCPLLLPGRYYLHLKEPRLHHCIRPAPACRCISRSSTSFCQLLLMLNFSPSFCLLMCFVPGSQRERVTAAAFPVQVDSDWFPAANWSDWFKGSQSSPLALQDAASRSCHCKHHRLKAPEESWAHQGTVHQVQSTSWMMQKCTYVFISALQKPWQILTATKTLKYVNE